MIPKFYTALTGPIAVGLAFTINHCATAEEHLALWYDQPATRWVEALPIGNGRVGAMVFGGVTNEHLQFNEGTLWTGQPHEYQHEGAVKFLPQLRQLLNQSRQLELEANRLQQEGKKQEAGETRRAARAKQTEAEAIAMKEFMSNPLRQQAYQPFGDVRGWPGLSGRKGVAFPARTRATLCWKEPPSSMVGAPRPDATEAWEPTISSSYGDRGVVEEHGACFWSSMDQPAVDVFRTDDYLHLDLPIVPVPRHFIEINPRDPAE
jgi:hypothetical protein